MHITQLRQADLNLLVVFAVLAEERSISTASKRLSLSQPAVSRGFGRLQSMFRDELMVRSKNGYELTPHAMRLMRELERILPLLDVLLRGSEFDPNKETVSFKILATDCTAALFGPRIVRNLLTPESRVSIEFERWSEDVHHDLDHGHADMLFHIDDGEIRGQMNKDFLYQDWLVCMVARESVYKKRMTLEQYAAAEHVTISILGVDQTMPDKPLRKLGLKRRSRLLTPYFGAAVKSIEKTSSSLRCQQSSRSSIGTIRPFALSRRPRSFPASIITPSGIRA